MKEHRPLKAGANPFTQENVPFVFEALGRQIPEWKLDEYKLCGVLPDENTARLEISDTIKLIPMGAARLRISAFPVADK